MELAELRKNEGKGKRVGFMLRVNQKEAIEIINSLSGQLKTGNPNTERIEFTEDNYRYFSISVV